MILIIYLLAGAAIVGLVLLLIFVFFGGALHSLFGMKNEDPPGEEIEKQYQGSEKE